MTLLRVDRTGYGRHRPTHLQSLRGCVERATPEACLDHYRHRRESGNDPIPFRKRTLLGLRSRRILRQNETLLSDGSVEMTVGDGMGHADPVSGHGHGVAPFLESGAMRGRVDPPSHA